jgi:predicted deacylase
MPLIIQPDAAAPDPPEAKPDPPEAKSHPPEANLPAGLPDFPVSIKAPDIAAFTAGNTGIPGFTSIESGRPGPHVMLVALVHGNEIAGAIVLAALLAAGFTPACGRLTMGFANLGAFARFDPAHPLPSRYIDEDLNRVWDDVQLFGVRRSAELDRAREMLPLVDSADMLLDLHTMLWPSDPVLLCGPSRQGRALGLAVGTPHAIIADQGHAGGKRLIDYGRFTEAGGRAAAILVEAGQHWEAPGIAQSRATVMALLAHAGMAPPVPAAPAPLLAEVTATITARTNRFVFTQPYRGGEVVAQADTLIAHDGDDEIRTPHENCLLVMPSLRAARGHTAVRLAKVK